jgi:hypothetical protein
MKRYNDSMAVVGSNSWRDPAHSFYLSSPLLGLARERCLAQRLISERQQACRHSYEACSEPPVASCQADVALEGKACSPAEMALLSSKRRSESGMA